MKATIEAPFKLLMVTELNALLCGGTSRDKTELSDLYWNEILPKDFFFFRLNVSEVCSEGETLRSKVANIVLKKGNGRPMVGKLAILLRIAQMTGETQFFNFGPTKNFLIVFFRTQTFRAPHEGAAQVAWSVQA